MVCYYHADRPAVGMCKHCQRGLCALCAAHVGDSLACRERHEKQVAAADEAMRGSILQSQRTAAGYVRNGVFYGLAGLAFVALGLIQYRFLGLQAVFFALIGTFLLYAAVANVMEARRYR
jgi:Flp pilus assembly protein TadB